MCHIFYNCDICYVIMIFEGTNPNLFQMLHKINIFKDRECDYSNI